MEVSRKCQLSCDVTHSLFSSGYHTHSSVQSLVPDLFHSLFCVSVRSVGPFEPGLIALPHASAGGRDILDLSLHSPTLGAGGRETLFFSFQIFHKFVHNVLLLVLVHQLVAQDVRLDLCLVSFKTHRIQDAIARRGLQQKLHHYQRNEIICP